MREDALSYVIGYDSAFLLFGIGLDIISMVKNELYIELPEDEAGFIALHIVNADMELYEMLKRRKTDCC